MEQVTLSGCLARLYGWAATVRFMAVAATTRYHFMVRRGGVLWAVTSGSGSFNALQAKRVVPQGTVLACLSNCCFSHIVTDRIVGQDVSGSVCSRQGGSNSHIVDSGNYPATTPVWCGSAKGTVAEPYPRYLCSKLPRRLPRGRLQFPVCNADGGTPGQHLNLLPDKQDVAGNYIPIRDESCRNCKGRSGICKESPFTGGAY